MGVGEGGSSFPLRHVRSPRFTRTSWLHVPHQQQHQQQTTAANNSSSSNEQQRAMAANDYANGVEPVSSVVYTQTHIFPTEVIRLFLSLQRHCFPPVLASLP